VEISEKAMERIQRRVLYRKRFIDAARRDAESVDGSPRLMEDAAECRGELKMARFISEALGLGLDFGGADFSGMDIAGFGDWEDCNG
jgi:hypothetical protein